MPADAPAVKREATAAEGADIVRYDRASEDRVAIAARIAAQTGAVVAAVQRCLGEAAGSAPARLH